MKTKQVGKTTVYDVSGEKETPLPTSVDSASSPDTSPSVSVNALADALTQAINLARPQKKNVFTRVKNTPWTPKNGEKKLKLKRKFYQHGIPVLEDRLTNAQVDLANKLRPGSYCDGYVKVIRRRDKGIDIDYPVRTAPQRLRLVTDFQITSLDALLQRCVDEAAKPKAPQFDEFGDAV